MRVTPFEGMQRPLTTGVPSRDESSVEAPHAPERRAERRPERLRPASTAEIHALMTYDANAKHRHPTVATHVDTYA